MRLLFTLFSMIGLSLSAQAAKTTLDGKVLIDGSSTVYPITEAVAEEFQKMHREVKVNVGISGTGGGFKKFVIGETDINDASRTIKEKEITKARSSKISYIELPVAFDGISVVVSHDNHFAKDLTMAELKKIWDTGSTVMTWKDIRPNWPNEKIKLFGPGTDSGTFDYFTEEVNGKSQRSRADFSKSEDDNVLVKGVAGSPYALGYFGFAYYLENKGKVNALKIDAGKGGVLPSMESINNSSYPLSRPIFIYVNANKAKTNPALAEFVRFYMKNAGTLSKEVGYVPLPKEMYTSALSKFDTALK